MRFLCLSDIHGHAKALRKVLDFARDIGFDQVICAGDLLFPGPEPLETWKLLVAHNALCVQGLTDAAVGRVDPDSFVPSNELERSRLERLLSFHDELGDLIVARLSRLPTDARLPLPSGHEMLVVHGSPSDPTEGFSVEMDDEEMNALIADDPADVIVCGACHVPFQRQIGETRVVNVGSVGEATVPGIANATLIEATPLEVRVHQYDIDI